VGYSTRFQCPIATATWPFASRTTTTNEGRTAHLALGATCTCPLPWSRWESGQTCSQGQWPVVHGDGLWFTVYQAVLRVRMLRVRIPRMHHNGDTGSGRFARNHLQGPTQSPPGSNGVGGGGGGAGRGGGGGGGGGGGRGGGLEPPPSPPLTHPSPSPARGRCEEESDGGRVEVAIGRKRTVRCGGAQEAAGQRCVTRAAAARLRPRQALCGPGRSPKSSQPKIRARHGPVGCARQRRRHDALGWY
jgi:hypothetical protein